MKAKLWGVRGSLPAPLEPQEIEQRLKAVLEGFFESGYQSKDDIDAYLSQLPQETRGGFGGNTPSCEVFTEDTSIIIDAGSGIRRKGYELVNGPCGSGEGEVHLFFTHFHWDHVIGLPFFAPVFIPQNRIHVYAVQPEVEDILRQLFRKPNFPVPYEQLGAEFVYHSLEPRTQLQIGSLKITPYQLDHPDPCWGYRITDGERVLAYCVDTECTRANRKDLGDDLPMYQQVNTMIFDAQYTLIESIIKGNWGHAAATIGLDVALREGMEKVIFMHHDPAADDLKIAEARKQTEQYLEYAARQLRKEGKEPQDVKWVFAHEEMVVTI